MIRIKNLRSVLIVSENKAFYENILTVLPPDEFEIKHVLSCGEARRCIQNRGVDIVILKMPLPDEHGLLFARDFIDSPIGIMLICSPEVYHLISAEGEQDGIVVLTDPCPPAFIYVAAKMLLCMISRLEKLHAKNRTLEEKMQDIRIVNKAKWALIDKKGMSEAEAHRYIEKLAMDKRMTNGEVAEMVLDTISV